MVMCSVHIKMDVVVLSNESLRRVGGRIVESVVEDVQSLWATWTVLGCVFMGSAAAAAVYVSARMGVGVLSVA